MNNILREPLHSHALSCLGCLIIKNHNKTHYNTICEYDVLESEKV